MPGLTDLDELLAHLDPSLDEREYVFVTIERARYGAFQDLEPLAAFAEEEGLTLVLERGRAESAGLGFDGVLRRITLTVHSSLEAVGLSAAVASALAEVGISANVIAAYHHDHVFVPATDAERALGVLRSLQQRSG
jgi:hypothetical protein